MKHRQRMTVHPVKQCLKHHAHRFLLTFFLIGLPLVHMQLLLRQVWIRHHLQSHIVKTLQCPHTGGADGYRLAIVGNQPFYGVTTYGDILRMHRMFANGLTLHRAERTGTHMQGELFPLNAMGIQVGKYLFREMETCRRGCHTSLDFRIYGLVSGLVALLCLTIQIGRNRQFARRVDNLSKGHITIPLKTDELTRPHLTKPQGP